MNGLYYTPLESNYRIFTQLFSTIYTSIPYLKERTLISKVYEVIVYATIRSARQLYEESLYRAKVEDNPLAITFRYIFLAKPNIYDLERIYIGSIGSIYSFSFSLENIYWYQLIIQVVKEALALLSNSNTLEYLPNLRFRAMD